MGIPPKKCHYSGYDYTLTKILKRMTVTLNWDMVDGIRSTTTTHPTHYTSFLKKFT